jgi:hypothetical protein
MSIRLANTFVPIGLHYVATGEKYLAEAVASRQSAKKHMPDVPAVIFTDLVDHPLTNEFEFVDAVTIMERSFHDVVEPLLRTPFEKTLHLDTDTFICGDCTDIFDALNCYEFAAVHDPYRCDLAIETLPQSMPTLNGGLLAYRITPSVTSLLESWPKIHQEKFAWRTKQNQPSLREAVHRSTARVLILPAEYNLRTWHPVAIGGFAKVKIIHDRRNDLPKLAAILNEGIRPRLFGVVNWPLAAYYYKTKAEIVLKRLMRRFTKSLANK